MMSGTALPSGFRSRPASNDDAEPVASVLVAVENTHDHGIETTPASLLSEWSSVDLQQESVVVEAPDGSIIAYADVLNHGNVSVNVYAYVHPDWTGRGIGKFLLNWGEQWASDRMHLAPDGVQVDVRQFIAAGDRRAQQLLQAHGYEPIRSTFVMQIVFDQPPPEPNWPPGIVPKVFRPGVDDRDVFEAVEDAFRDVWGRPGNTFERFKKFSQAPELVPELWIIARATSGEIAGVCLGEPPDVSGWISTVGVRRAYRRQGLGLALLHAGFGSFYRHGIRDIRLSVDAKSLTGAPRLYQRAGMQALSSYVLHQKILRAGIDPGDATPSG